MRDKIKLIMKKGVAEKTLQGFDGIPPK